MVTISPENIKASLQRLLVPAGIRRILFVDDMFHPGIEEIIGKIKATVEKASFKGIDEFKDIPFDGDSEIWEDSLKKRWEKLGKEKKVELEDKILGNDETKVNAILRSILPSEIDLILLSLEDWSKEKTTYIGSDDILFLFDQSFLKESGGDAETGYILIKEVSKKCDACCAILSNTFNKNEAYTKWIEYAEKYDLKRSRFVLIAKELLLEPGMLGFIHMIKLMRLKEPCGVLLEKIAAIIKESYDGAIKELRSLDIYNFDHAVFRTSYQEGIWEPDTLLRLFAIFQKELVREKYYCDKDVHQMATIIREISYIPSKLNPSTIGNSLTLQRAEMYETGDRLKKIHMPLELGDIFQKADNRLFIILGQPCDLMLRSNGDRSYNLSETLVAEIVSGEKKEHYYELKYFKDTGIYYFVDFKQIHNVSLYVLDLCVYDNNGEAVYVSGKPCPPIIIPSWKEHFIEIAKYYENVMSRYSELLKDQRKKEELLLVVPKSSRNNLFQPTVKIDKTEKTISYDCKRICKINQPYSGATLTAYANFMARTAFEHDWTKPGYEDEHC